jgi:hypothetical protein
MIRIETGKRDSTGTSGAFRRLRAMKKTFIIEHALTNITHPPQWEGQLAKSSCQRSGGWGRRSSGTLELLFDKQDVKWYTEEDEKKEDFL